MSLLTVEEVSRSFGGLQAVSGVSFTVVEGEMLGLIGPNGAGKTTLFHVLSGFLSPDRGRVRYACDRTRSAGAAWCGRFRSRGRSPG